MRLALLIAVALSLACQGCSLSPLDAARLSLGATVAAYDAVEPRLEAARREDGAVCLALTVGTEVAPCLAGVRTRWAPVRAASERVYRAVVAALALLHLSEAGTALGQGVDAARLARAVSMAVDALGALEALVGPVDGGAKDASGVEVKP